MLLCCLLCGVFQSEVVAQEAPELQITSKYYVVLDADTGEIYAQRDVHHQAPIASLTKIFTTVEALERAPLSTEITTSESDLVPADATTMGFGPGETFSLEELLFGMMLPSGNDAANAVARSMGTSQHDATDDQAVERFVGWMNQRAQAMGLVDTHLVNPDGWGVPNHYSSVYDLAAFTRYALQYPTFVSLISTESYSTDNGYTVTNTNKMLNTYQWIVGGKTGYDNDAGYCLIEVASRGDTTMISVTLDGVAPDDWYDDNRVLLDYAFEQKADREEIGQPFAGDIVAFNDPGATLVDKSFLPGGSGTGQVFVAQASSTPETASEASSPEAGIAVVASPSAVAPIQSVSDDTTGNSDSSGLKLLAVAAVALLVIGIRSADTWRRNPSGMPWSLRPKAALVSQAGVVETDDDKHSTIAEASDEQ
jgi:D-alanyl-D-alanine carboxypeptidase